MDALYPSLLVLSACAPALEIDERTGYVPGGPTWAPPSTETSDPSTERDEILLCDLPEIPVALEVPVSGATMAQPLPFYSQSMAIVPGPDGTSDLVVPVFAVDESEEVSYWPYTDFTIRIDLQIFSLPLPRDSEAIPRATLASVWSVDGWSYVFGDSVGAGFLAADLTGDGVDELVYSAWEDYWSHHSVFALPLPDGEHEIEELALASYGTEGSSALSAGDYSGDGIGDLAIGGAYRVDYLSGSDGRFFGAQVIEGPPVATNADEVPSNGAAAWFNLFEPEIDIVGGWIGERSSMVEDVTGDGYADLLVNHDTSLFGLFAGGSGGEHDQADVLAWIEVPCDTEITHTLDVGDVTGDGRRDLAVLGPDVALLAPRQGALWILSRLDEIDLDAERPVSLTALADPIFVGLDGEHLHHAVGVDLDQDGAGDLVVSTDKRLYVFLGPLAGMRGLESAELVVEVALGAGEVVVGDADRDGISDLVVMGVSEGFFGDTFSGTWSIYPGRELLQALP